MDKINILNKQGLLTKEDRKESLSHGCSYVSFESSIDLIHKPIKVIPYSPSGKITRENYSRDLASFMVWWTHFVYKDLNGFSGFSNVKFDFSEVKFID